MCGLTFEKLISLFGYDAEMNFSICAATVVKTSSISIFRSSSGKLARISVFFF